MHFLVIWLDSTDQEFMVYENANGVIGTALKARTLRELIDAITAAWTPMTVRVQNDGLRRRVRTMLPGTWRVVNIQGHEVTP